VHGAGPQISAEMERRRLEVTFVGGRRVTSARALEVVRDSFAEVNAALCAAIGPAAIGLMGDEIGIQAVPVPELGFVGDPHPSRPEAVERALVAGRIPVVAPLARGPLNVNADETAVALGEVRVEGAAELRIHGSLDVLGDELDDLLAAQFLNRAHAVSSRYCSSAARTFERARCSSTR